jgi:hypothetical protein
MPKKHRRPVVFELSDNRYDKPFRYSKKLNAYVVTLQDKTKSQPGIYDVVPDGGDRAVPRGVVQASQNGVFHSFLYHPAFHADLYATRPIGDFGNLDEAAAAILEA